MAQVPYTGVPTVAPSTEGQPTVSVPTPIDAFGGGIAKAIESAGGEIFQRAMAIQEVNNQTMANDAATNFIEQSSQMRAKYLNSRGGDAVNNLDSHLASIRQLQEQVGQNLNPAALRQYNNETRRIVAWNMMSAATHAASEGKNNALTSIASKRQALHDQLISMPDNDILYHNTEQQLRDLEHTESGLRGYDPDVAEQRFNTERSKLAAGRSIALARTNPPGAVNMSRKYIDGKVIIGDDISRVQSAVRHEMNNTGARLLTSDTMSGRNFLLGSSIVPIDIAKMAIRGTEARSYTEVGIETKHGHALGLYQVMSDNLQEFLKDAGMPAMTESEFLNSPNAQEELFAKRFGGYMQKYGSFNEAASRWFTGSSIADARARGAHDPLGTNIDTYLQRSNSYLSKHMSLKDMLGKVETQATTMSDDPLFVDYAKDKFTTEFNKSKAVERDDMWRNNNAIAGVLMGLNNPGGVVPTTVDEFRASPEGDAAWQAADNIHKDKIMKQLLSNSKGERSFTEGSYRTYMQYRGMAISDDAETRKNFMEIDPETFMSLPIPFAARGALVNLQQKLKQKSEADPRVSYAMGRLQESGILNGVVDKRVDPDAYNLFTAILQDRLELAQRMNAGKPISLKDILDIGKDMVYRKVSEHWWQSDEDPAFMKPPPDDEREKIIQSLVGQGITPTELFIQREWRNRVYKATIQPTKEKLPEKPVPKSDTVSGNFISRGIDRLSDAIENYDKSTKPGRAKAEAEEAAIRQQQVDLLTERSRSRGE